MGRQPSSHTEAAGKAQGKGQAYGGFKALLLAGIVLLQPSRQMVVSVAGLAVGYADILVAVTALLFVVHFLLSRRTYALRALPVPTLLLVLWMALSLFPELHPRGLTYARADTLVSLRELGQAFEYLVVVVIIFSLGVTSDKVIFAVLLALFVRTTILLGFAAEQYFAWGREALVSAMDVDGGLGNRNVLAAWLCLVLPLALGVGLRSGGWGWSVWALILCAAGLLLTTSGGLFVALCVGLLVVAFLHRRWLLPVGGGALVLLLVFVWPALPRHNAGLLYESVAFYRSTDHAKAFAGRLGPNVMFEDLDLRLNSDVGVLKLMRDHSAPVDPRQLPEITAARFAWPRQQLYTDWQASVNMMLKSPLTGVGVGGYEANIPAAYRDIPRYPTNLVEDDAHSLYMVLGATAGLPAFFFIVWTSVSFWRKGVEAAFAGTTGEGLWEGVAAGGVGAVTALMIGAFYSEFLTRGLGIGLGIILGLIVAAHRYICESRAPTSPKVISQKDN